MRRPFILCCLCVLLLSPGLAAAKVAEHNGHGPGASADPETVEGVIAFIDMFVQKMNACDATIVNAANEPGLAYFYAHSYEQAVNNVASGMFAPIHLYDTRDVLVHVDGAVSVELTFSGYDPYYDNLFTERWYFFPDGSGSYILNDGDFTAPGDPVRIPESLSSTSAVLSLNHGGLGLDPTQVGPAQVLDLQVVNEEPSAWVTTGIYILPAGVEPVEAQKEIVSYDNAGSQGSFPFEVAVLTPVKPGETIHVVFMLQPDVTYMVQQWSLDAEGRNPTPLQGEQFVTTFTVVPALVATPT